MFQPFVKLEARLVEAFIKQKERYLVSQTYKALQDYKKDEKIYLLFTPYSDLSRARIHLSALDNERYAAIIDLENELHKNKILAMLQSDKNYVLYAAVVQSKSDLEKNLKTKYINHIRRYVSKHTSWKIGSDKTISSDLDITFGELFVLLKYNNQRIRVHFSEIENA